MRSIQTNTEYRFMFLLSAWLHILRVWLSGYHVQFKDLSHHSVQYCKEHGARYKVIVYGLKRN